MLDLFIATLASLFTIVNPVGAVPVYLAMTPHYTEADRQRTARQTSIWFAAILLAFFLGGKLILSFFGLGVHAIRIAGGIVIMLSGYGLLAGHYARTRAIDKKVKQEAMEKEDISFTPLAMPLLSGPGSISLLINWATEYTAVTAQLVIVAVILLNAVIVLFVLRSAPWLGRLLGASGMSALSRIMGFLVMAIGVQSIITGIVQQVQALL